MYERLIRDGWNPFLDTEELDAGHFNTKLYERIDECTNFLLILNAGSLDRCVSAEDWVYKEINHAIPSGKEKNIIPVMMEGFVFPPKEKIPESIRGIIDYQGVSINQTYFDAAYKKLESMLIREKPAKDSRSSNTYFTYQDKKEITRLKIQQALMYDFDASVFQRTYNSFDSLNVLDVGSNNGDTILSRIGLSDKVKHIVCLEYDEETVNVSNEKYKDNEKISFHQTDLDSELLSGTLSDITSSLNIGKFNLVVMSMILLHLGKPYDVLKTVRKYLEPGGVIIVRDIDDGLSLAYPDKDGAFQKVINICDRNETAGYRKRGRGIFTLLQNTGYKNIRLEKCGLSTVGMDIDGRDAMFETYFSFILEDLALMRQKYPDNSAIKKDYDWNNDCFEDLRERFLSNDFLFNLELVLFTAQK